LDFKCFLTQALPLDTVLRSAATIPDKLKEFPKWTINIYPVRHLRESKDEIKPLIDSE